MPNLLPPTDEAAQGPGTDRAQAGSAAPITRALIAINVLVFLLEEYWGGSTRQMTLVRMGAVFAGAPPPISWLGILSYAYLHIGPIHLGMNMLGLWSMGRALEPWLGPARIYVLYSLSAIGGGVAIHMASHAHVTAGASGALFGLLAAACVPLVLRYRGAFFDVERRRIRDMLAKILVPNILISLLPGVSFMGHLGGFLVGALFAARMLLRNRGSGQRLLPEPNSLGLTICACLLATLTLASVALTWLFYEPWSKNSAVL